VNPERWEQVQDILAAVEDSPAEERKERLDDLCGKDAELRREVESLLDASVGAEQYFDGLAERAIDSLEKLPDRPSSASLIGRHLERFKVVDKLGEGGMGEVYLATDLELRRDVALKVLPDRLLDDVHQAARFKREAQLLASLNHPSISAIYGMREVEGRQVIILELVDGPTLTTLMADRRLPLQDALEIGRDVASALEAAHAHGIVHRDLKPSNIKLTAEGKVKVLDFGIAKAVRPDPDSGSDLSPVTTSLLAATQTGFVAGTVSYMSPEQLKGKKVDTRADIWAFGAVLFEMLAGERPFRGDGFAMTLAKVLEHPPDWDALPSDLSPNVRHLLERCLERDVNRRLQAIGEARIVLEDALADISAPSILPPGRRGPVRRSPTRVAPAPWWKRLAAGAGVAALGALVTFLLTRPPTAPLPPVERFVSPLRAGQEPVVLGVGSFTLTPDGQLLVYRGPGESGSGNRLWVRRWSEIDAFPLRGTEGGLGPSVSPDGRQLAFSQNGEVRVLSLAGGPSRPITRGINPRWGPEGRIYVTTPTGIARVDLDGSDPQPVTTRAEGEGNHFLLDILPGGTHALISVDHLTAEPEIRALNLESGDFSPLVAGTSPRYAPSGHLVYLHEGSLLAAPFDLEARRLAGPALPLLDGVLSFVLADDGSLVYSTGAGAVGSESELVWVDRAGQATPVSDGWYFDPGGANPGWSLSPDGLKIALRVGGESGNRDIWVRDLEAHTSLRLTFHPAEDRKPRWSPDGQSVIFLSARAGDLDVWSKRADGAGGEPELVYDHAFRIAEAAWSPDGQWLVMRTAGVQDLTGGRDIVALRHGVDTVAARLLDADYDESSPAVSPDSRWLAYNSNETGRNELYVRPFPDVETGRWQVTTQGGTAPVWAHNGRELFYIDAGRRLMSVRYASDPGFRVEGVDALFTIPPGYDLAQVAALYDVDPSDERFLMARVYRGDEQSPRVPEVVLVKNFFTELSERAVR
jgi:Tol biopolymer transport system component/tRNA A-37 threonylcarbamoyl transferase component Bud32